MSNWSDVHLMFCEGPHDAAFLNRLLKKKLDFAKAELKLSELPPPISNVLQQSVKTRAAEDLRLDLAKKFFLPDYLVERDKILVMIFNYGGSNRQISISQFLEKVFLLLNTPAFAAGGQPYGLPKFTFAVFADADSVGLEAVRGQISEDLKTIGGAAWLSGDWRIFKDTKAATQDTEFGSVAAYIWKKSDEDNGTLEDVVLECLCNDQGLQQTMNFLDKRFNWVAPADATPEAICAVSAKRLKAAFCVEGQRKKPGGSLAVVLDQTELLNKDCMDNSPAVKDCVKFLKSWIEIASHADDNDVNELAVPELMLEP